MHELIAKLGHWYHDALNTWGAWAIGLMMALESTIVPIPSELVIPPAAHLAHTGKIQVSLTAIVIAGALGSWVGAALMYWAARIAGRPLVLRYGKYFLISPDKVEGAERWAAHYGGMGIFISRLLPVVRHLIGIPAGIVRMNFWKFSLFTLLGAGIWSGVLCYIGIKMGQDENLMKGELHAISLWLGGAMVVLGGLYYFFVHKQMRTVVEKPEARIDK